MDHLPWIICHVVGEKLSVISLSSEQQNFQRLERELPLDVACLTVDERGLLLWHEFERIQGDIMTALTNADDLLIPPADEALLDPTDLTDWLGERVDQTQDGLLFVTHRQRMPVERIPAEERENIGGDAFGYTKNNTALERGHDFPRHAHRSCTVTLLIYDLEFV